jgi:hypothetical protein
MGLILKEGAGGQGFLCFEGWLWREEELFNILALHGLDFLRINLSRGVSV